SKQSSFALDKFARTSYCRCRPLRRHHPEARPRIQAHLVRSRAIDVGPQGAQVLGELLEPPRHAHANLCVSADRPCVSLTRHARGARREFPRRSAVIAPAWLPTWRKDLLHAAEPCAIP